MAVPRYCRRGAAGVGYPVLMWASVHANSLFVVEGVHGWGNHPQLDGYMGLVLPELLHPAFGVRSSQVVWNV